MKVIATAGHVDHGKSSLVRALSGIDPDRWAEEKLRGLTIDLGFAHTTLPDGSELSFIDVPGHTRFLKNMLAGVSSIDACLFVVSAVEGWKQQSQEHLGILQLLGTQAGVLAITKSDLVDQEWLELVRLEIEDHLVGTFLESAPIVAVDSLSGTGIAELLRKIVQVAEGESRTIDINRPRLWVDRSFAAKGSGTVLTGTLIGGSISVDEHFDILSTHTANVTSNLRVRGLQSHGRSVTTAPVGSRVAVNLNGVAHGDVVRGDVLCKRSQWHVSNRFDASLTTLADLDHIVSRKGAFTLHVGSVEAPVKIRLLGATSVEPGETINVRFRIGGGLALLPGDRYILRESGRDETVGGGAILDVDPTLPASKAKPTADPQRLVEERSFVDLSQYARLTGTPWAGPVIANRWAITAPALAQRQLTLYNQVADAGSTGLDIGTLSEIERAILDELVAIAPTEVDTTEAPRQPIVIDGSHARMGDAVDHLADHPFVKALRANLFTPPDPTPADRLVLRELIRKGRVIEADGAYFAPEAIEQAARIIAALLEENAEGATVAQVREALGCSRKHALPLLAYFDSTGRTRRRGDFRIAGPRLLDALPIVGR